MNISALKRLTLAFHGYRNELDDDGNDLEGEVIDASNPDGGTDEPEDRGDNFTPPGETPPAAPAPAPAPAAAKPGATDDNDDATTSAGIPKARFNEVNERRKLAEQAAESERLRAEALERELQAYRSGKPGAAPAPAPATAPAFDEDAKEAAYQQALMDGDLAQASAIRKEINQYLRSSAKEDAKVEVFQEMTQRQQAAALQAVSTKAVEDYPFLDTPDGEEALELILASRDRRIAEGVPPHQALQLAVNAIAPRFAPSTGGTPPHGLQTPNKGVDTRTTRALARGATDSISQAPQAHVGVGNRATAGTIDVSEMTDEQFEALSPAEKAKARGDSL